VQKDLSKNFRSKIADVEKSMLGNTVDRIELVTKHHFAHGVYARELAIPKGCKLTGKIHRYSTINIMLKGSITVATENGLKRVEAPAIIVSPPGTKRAGHAHEETIWVTVHPTHQTDPELVEQEVIAENFYELENSEPPILPAAGLNKTEKRTLLDLLAKEKTGPLQNVLNDDARIEASIELLNRSGYKVTKC